MSTSKPKGKQATRGLKQILEENEQTIKFYFNVLSITQCVYLLVTYFIFWPSFTTMYICLFGLTASASWLAFYFMKSMAAPVKEENGAIIDAGSDLNMTGHISEYLKDIILFSTIVQLMSFLSSYFWWLLVIAPVYVFYLLWKNFLGPWFFAPAPESTQTDDKQDGKKPKEKIKYVRR